jgi:hypothetical protein
MQDTLVVAVYRVSRTFATPQRNLVPALHRAELTRLYAAMPNNVAMNVAWALMSSPPVFRTCPFLIMVIAS